MKTLLATVGLVCGMQFFPIAEARAQQDDGFEAARMSARRTLEIANIELRLYLQVEYPREQRRLDGQIKLAEAELRAYEERLREYRPFGQFSTGRPLLFAEQDYRLVLMEAELRLDDLRAERNAMIRFHSDRWRLLELRANEARAYVAHLEGGDQIVLPGEAVAKQ